MALDACCLEDRCNVFGIGHCSRLVSGGTLELADQAAHCRVAVYQHFAASQQRSDRLAQRMALRLVAHVADAVLIVDAALIADSPLAIQYEYFWRARCPENLHESLFRIAQQRELELMPSHMRR